MKNDLIKEQNIDFNETSLFKNVLNLAKALQSINFVEILLIKSKS